jgi:hypothetical protein
MDEIKKCKLEECGKEFTPTVYWQHFCCKNHADKARHKRYAAKLKRAVAVMEKVEKGEITQP